LYGRIIDRWDGSVSGAQVELVSGPDAGMSVFATNPALYEFRNLRAGTYQVRVSREGYQTRDVQQELVADTELNIRLEVRPLPPQVGTFEGRVEQLDTGQRLESVLVEATIGVGAGRATFTSGAGVFRFELPAGTTKFRWSKEGYVSREAEYTITNGARTEVQVFLQKVTTPPPFPPPPYTFTGIVRDSQRNGVAGAEIWLYSNGSPIDDRRGSGFTDSSGRYTIILQRTAQSVRAMKNGYVPNDASIFASSNSSMTFVTDVTIKKIDRYTLLSPTSIRVGELIRMEGRVELDDGSNITGGCVCSQLTSSDPSIIAVDGTGYSGFIRGVAPGSATLTGTYYGVTTTLAVRVNP
jgi:carboxypeptidase family protein